MSRRFAQAMASNSGTTNMGGGDIRGLPFLECIVRAGVHKSSDVLYTGRELRRASSKDPAYSWTGVGRCDCRLRRCNTIGGCRRRWRSGQCAGLNNRHRGLCAGNRISCWILWVKRSKTGDVWQREGFPGWLLMILQEAKRWKKGKSLVAEIAWCVPRRQSAQLALFRFLCE